MTHTTAKTNATDRMTGAHTVANLCPGQGLLPRFILIYVLLLVMALAQSAFAQTSRTTNVAGVDVTISLNKTNISVGEPIILKITMENVSGQGFAEALVNYQLSEGNDLEVIVQPAGELESRYAGAFEAGAYPAIPLNLFSNSPISFDTLLLFDSKQPSGLLFSEPGTYEVTGNFRFRLGGSTSLSSAAIPPTKIVVTPAAGAVQEALTLLDEPDLIRALHLGIIPTTGIVSRIEDAAARFPATALGSLAMRAQGHYYARGMGNDLERGTDLLQQFLADGQVPLDQDGTAWNIMTAYHINKDYDLAREWAFNLIRNYPTSIRIRAEDALLYYYYFAPAQFAADSPWYLLKAPWNIPGVEPPTDLRPRQGTQ